MANSNNATIQDSIQITVGSKQYQSKPTSFNASVQGSNGPTPGTVLCGVNHTEPSFAQLAGMGGFVWMQNLDPVNFVTVGIYSSHFAEFFPVHDILPGEFYRARLSVFLGIDLAPGTGSHAEDAFTNKLSIKANGAPCIVRIDAFDP